MKRSHNLNPGNFRIVLVLQGGGALGAYQAGVYQAMHEHGLLPDWVVGTSIGAINAALVAGNAEAVRLQRLQEFWRRVSHREEVDLAEMPDSLRQCAVWWSAMETVMRGTPGFFTPRLFSPFQAGLPVAPETASFYDTAPLTGTLEELIDFDYLNAPGGIRLTINALKVTTGELVSFDNRVHQLDSRHIRASGALPPGFPPVRIDGELYWDGGLYSNTPLETVLDDSMRVDTLCFMVDLWSPMGPEPTTLDEVETRQKDVLYASRSQRHIEDYLRLHQIQDKLRELYALLPEHAKTGSQADELADLGCDSIIHVVRIPYTGRDWHMASKDINFLRGSILWRWEQGYRNAVRAIEYAAWLTQVPQHAGVVVHSLPP